MVLCDQLESAQQRPREQLGQVAGLLEALDRREHQLDRPLGREAFRFERVGKSEPADDEVPPPVPEPAVAELAPDEPLEAPVPPLVT